MRALVIDGPRSMTLRNVPTPDGECRIRVKMAGVCGTDLQLLEGYAAFRGIPGHEFVGVVESVELPADARWVGRRVVGEINVGCGRCDWCAAGIKEHCTARTVVGIRGRAGAFAEFLTLPSANLHHVPDQLDDGVAVFVEPLAAACRILEQVAVHAGDRIAVIGDGRLGLLVGQVLKTAAPDVTVIGRHERKLAVAEQLNLAVHRAGESGRDPFDIVVDASGRADGLRCALDIVRPRGTVVLKSTFHGEAPLETWPVVVNEVTLVGSRCGPFDRAIALLASGAIQVRPLIDAITPLDDYAAAFAQARRALKVLLRIA